MANWKLTLEYDGRRFSGWQRQLGARTVQEELEGALARVFGVPRVITHAAGRTDAGVHALGQVVSFRAEPERDPLKLTYALNSLLPEDVACRVAERAEDRFHARFGAVDKTYRYVVLDRVSRSPFLAGRAWHSRHPLDWAAVEAGLEGLRGTHDFSAFRGPGCEQRNPVRTITRAEHHARGEEHHLEFDGPGFLKYQVRIMVGTLLECGLARRDPAAIPALLAGRDRTLAGRTASPAGLYLVEVRYGPTPAATDELEG